MWQSMRNEPLVRMIRVAALIASGGLAACSGQASGQAAGRLGYGTPGVSEYVQSDEATNLQALLDRCAQVPQAGAASQIDGLPAACGQLRRTSRNQPGNAVQPGQAR